MANGWTHERRARQAELIRKWRPWEKSTGPTTQAGKDRSKNNRFNGGHRQMLRELTKQMNELLKEQQEALQRL